MRVARIALGASVLGCIFSGDILALEKSQDCSVEGLQQLRTAAESARRLFDAKVKERGDYVALAAANAAAAQADLWAAEDKCFLPGWRDEYCGFTAAGWLRLSAPPAEAETLQRLVKPNAWLDGAPSTWHFSSDGSVALCMQKGLACEHGAWTFRLVNGSWTIVDSKQVACPPQEASTVNSG